MTHPIALLEPTQPQARQSELCIHEMFEQQVRRSPNAVAVTCGDSRLTYAELNTKANQLARHLVALGVKTETPVMLYLERSLEMVVAILAVLKAGGAYVPVDLAYPKDRLEFMLEDSRAPVLITQARLRENLPRDKGAVICLDGDAATLSAHSADNLEAAVGAENAAYIIYTSGSTGKPKGVIVTHHNVVRLLNKTEHWYRFNSADVWPLFHSYAFDVSVFELWGCLFYGGRLVVVPYLVSRSPADFYELLAREGVTVLNQTPSAFRQLIWAEENAPVKRSLKLRYVVCAGEALELQSLKPWFERHGDEQPKVVNMYGITEITVHATYRVIHKSDLTSGVGSVIGVPIPDLQIYLVDDDLKPVPTGVPGEICVGGAGVARGYLNRPELNARRFISDPFSSDPAARMYRSGDLAQYSPTGELEYLGRMDHQVKIRGFRVELGEIESALNRHPGIRESVVIAQDTPAGDKRLIAYFVPVQAAPSVTELRAHLGSGLPDYMIPAFFIPLKAFPLTTNGKIDRRALPAPDHSRPDIKSEFIAPSTEREKLLADIWSEVLGIHQVGVKDNLFELGGDSIRCIAILSKAQQKGIHLTLQQMFQNPTVAALAACADANPQAVPMVQSAPFSLISEEDKRKLGPEIEDAYPIAQLQLGMFFHNELNPISAMYHDVFSYRVKYRFNSEKLQAATQRVVARHSTLRTSFHLAGFSRPLQLVHAEVTAPFTIEDLRHGGNLNRDEATKAWIESEKRRPFDRSRPPLVRFHVQVFTDENFQFFISFHHSCLDGWSLAAVLTEIFQEYTAEMAGHASGLQRPQSTYRQFIALEQQSIANEPTRDFWRRQMEGAALPLLPRWGREHCSGGTEQNRGPELYVPGETVEKLRELAQRLGVPLKSVLLAAHARVLATVHGQTDIVTGLISNGRPEEMGAERLTGLFLNSLPFRFALSGGSWQELVRETFEREQGIIPHRRFPMAEIQKLNGGRPLFETAFDFVHFHVFKTLENCPGLEFSESHYFEANNLSTYTTFMLDSATGRLELHIDYDPNHISARQIQQMSEYYLATLKAMASGPESRYETFSVLPDAERQLALREHNQTEVEFPRDKYLHELIAERAKATPDAPAIVFKERTVSYAELDQQAESLANHLRASGVGSGSLVGIFQNRSPQMVASLLGILKTGAAYVPLDPAYPAERLAFMLEDSKASVVVTERALRNSLPPSGAAVLEIDNLSAEPGEAANQVPAKRSSDDLAYVIFTSGSTGKPKGVQVTHRSVVNLLLSAANTAGITNADNLLAVTTLSFDIAGLELFMPLVLGARITLADRETASDGTQLARLIENAQPTVMQATPATWRLLIESGWQGLKSLKIFCGGEALKPDLANKLLGLSAGVWNFYGPTETTIWSTAWKVQPGQKILIGSPLANTQLYIVDAALNPVPTGTPGELLIGGEGVARGYLNRPQLTAERFIPDPFSGKAGARLYRTGDLARRLPDGQIECLGRLDQQVKIRGFRIEPGEVETVLKSAPGIADAIVVSREDGLGESRLVAYATSRNGPPSLKEVRAHLQAHLPGYMVPSQFMILESFPLTPNGKVDVKSLPAPERQTVVSREFSAPATLTEKALAEIWEEVLSNGKIGVDDNFFELGGDSLSATRVFARINKSLGSELTLREMLEHPTVKSLAECVAKSTPTAATHTRTIQPRARR